MNNVGWIMSNRVLVPPFLIVHNIVFISHSYFFMDNNNTNFRRFFGAALTILGVVVVLFALVAFLSEGKAVLGLHVSKAESAAPFIVGMIFLVTGVNLVRES